MASVAASEKFWKYEYISYYSQVPYVATLTSSLGCDLCRWLINCKTKCSKLMSHRLNTSHIICYWTFLKCTALHIALIISGLSLMNFPVMKIFSLWRSDSNYSQFPGKYTNITYWWSVPCTATVIKCCFLNMDEHFLCSTQKSMIYVLLICLLFI